MNNNYEASDVVRATLRAALANNDYSIERLMEIKAELSDTYHFVEYLESIGFHQANYECLLELNKEVPSSISNIFKGKYGFEQFLLSTKVNYSDLERAEIEGAYGYLEETGLNVPKTPGSDAHFFGPTRPKVPYRVLSYRYPKIMDGDSDYDLAISQGLAEKDKYDSLIKNDIDIFIGDVLDMSKPSYMRDRELLLERLKTVQSCDSRLKLNKETHTSIDREFIVLSRKSR